MVLGGPPAVAFGFGPARDALLTLPALRYLRPYTMFTFQNFKSFADAKIDLSHPLTVLIGKNGSGKTNVIEGIELLGELARGRPLHEISDIGRGGGFEVRGGLAGCARNGAGGQFSLGFEGTFVTETETFSVNYQLKLQTQTRSRIFDEKLIINDFLEFRVIDSHEKKVADLKNLRIEYKDDLRESQTRQMQVSDDLSVLFQSNYFPDIPSDAASKFRLPRIRFNIAMMNMCAFDPQPKLMRTYERVGNHTLMSNGSNLSAVLYALNGDAIEQRSARDRILNCIRQLPEEPFAQFDFEVTRLNDVMFGLQTTAAEPMIDARLLSDGTLRCLAVLAAVETVAENSRVIIEEFDNGLHPSRVGMLTQAIWETAKRRNLNVLVTTHNPATLDSLTPEQLQGVVVCFWDQAQKASRLLPLLEIPKADVLLERGQLGDLVTQRILEQHLEPGFAEAQQKKAKAWLESLK